MMATAQKGGQRKGIWALVLTLTTLTVTTTIWFFQEGPPTAETLTTGAGDQPTTLPRINWPAGQQFVYQVRYRSEDMMRPIVDDGVEEMVSDPMTSSFDAELALTITGLGQTKAGTTQIAVSVARCDRALLVAAGQTLWDSTAQCEEALLNQTLYAEVLANGRIKAVYSAARSEAMVATLLQQLLLRMQVTVEPTLPPGDAWFANEKNLTGTVSNIYRLTSGPAGSSKRSADWVFERRTTAYHALANARGMRTLPQIEVEGGANFTINEQGTLLTMNGHENLQAQTPAGVEFISSKLNYTFSLKESRNVAVAAPAWASLQRREPHALQKSPTLAQQLLEKRVAGLTLQNLLTSLRRYGNGGRMPDHARFLWRATGLLRLHPAYALALIPLYEEDGAHHRRQALILDLWASAGHEKAQVAMRQVLQNEEALATATDQERYQRLGFLTSPDEETLQMVTDHYQRFNQGKSEEHRGAQVTTAYSLGALAGKLAQGDADAQQRAQELNAMLLDDLRETEDPAMLKHRISALGNTRLPGNAEILTELSAHPSSAVRQHAARALGKTPSPEAEPALLALSADDDAIVQRNALRSLAPSVPVFETLLQHASDGLIAQSNMRVVIDLAKQGKNTYREQVTELLQTLIAQGIDNKLDRAAAHQLLMT